MPTVEEMLDLLVKQNEGLLGRIEALETVLASVLPEFNKSDISSWVEKKRKEDLVYIGNNLPVVMSSTVTVNGAQIPSGYSSNSPTFNLSLFIGQKTVNCSVKLPSYAITMSS